MWEDSPDDSLMPGVVAGSLQIEQGVGPRPSLLAQRVDADVDSEFLRRALCYMPADLYHPCLEEPLGEAYGRNNDHRAQSHKIL